MRHQRPIARGDAGFSLIAVSLAIAVIAGITPILLKSAQDSIRLGKMETIHADYQDLAVAIRDGISCTAMPAPDPCDEYIMINARDSTGAVVFSSDFNSPKNMLGNYIIRVSCRADAATGRKSIVIKAQLTALYTIGSSVYRGWALHPMKQESQNSSARYMGWLEVFKTPLCTWGP